MSWATCWKVVFVSVMVAAAAGLSALATVMVGGLR